MSDKPNYRFERIERLLEELRYEVTRGMMEREVDEEIGYRFTVPVSNKIEGGVVWCEFRTRPVSYISAAHDASGPKLRVVK